MIDRWAVLAVLVCWVGATLVLSSLRWFRSPALIDRLIEERDDLRGAVDVGSLHAVDASLLGATFADFDNDGRSDLVAIGQPANPNPGWKTSPSRTSNV